MRMRFFMCVLATIFFSHSSIAQTIEFKCALAPVDSEGTEDPTERLMLDFAVDEVTTEAFMIGNNGTASVEFHSGFEGVTFLEKLLTGVVQTTTVATSGIAVHSRHSIIAGEIVPSQYVGSCEVGQR